jgi:hypothetical protein
MKIIELSKLNVTQKHPTWPQTTLNRFTSAGLVTVVIEFGQLNFSQL